MGAVVFPTISTDDPYAALGVVGAMKDINQREFIVLGLCAVPVVLIGVWPAPLLDVMHATVANLVHQVVQTKLTGG